MVVSGDSVGTNANWRRVRSVRIGMVLRSAPGATQINEAIDLYPFGVAKDAATSGNVGGVFKSTDDKGSTFTPPVDNRLRQVVTFTIHFRNDQSL